MAANAVFAAGITGEQNVASFAAGTTLASGVPFLLVAVLCCGWIAPFPSRAAVATGLLFGAAIDAAIGQLPKPTGTDTSASNSLRQQLWSWFGTLDETSATTLTVGTGRDRRLRAAPDRAGASPVLWSSSSAA